MSILFAVTIFLVLALGLMSGHPIAFVLGGVGVVFGLIGWGHQSIIIFVNNIFGVMNNYALVAIPLFVLMANFLTSSKVTEGLFESVRYILGRIRGGLGVSVILVCTVFAACTGIIGASIVTMGLLSFNTLLKRGYDKSLTSGLIIAGGSLGILIPPSIMLVVLASVAQLSVGKLFMAAFIPGIILSLSYYVYILFICWKFPDMGPSLSNKEISNINMRQVIVASILNIIPPAILILGVLGSIYLGIATPTEASGVGAFIALLMTIFYRSFSWEMLRKATFDTAKTTAMVMAIMIGAKAFTSVFLGLGGDEVVKSLVDALKLGEWGIFFFMMIISFILGCFLDWIGIVMIVLPIFLPLLKETGFNMLWIITSLAVLLQTCFLTPPFGYGLFYLKGIAPPSVTTVHIYKGVIPFILLIIVVFLIIVIFPDTILWLPSISKA